MNKFILIVILLTGVYNLGFCYDNDIAKAEKASYQIVYDQEITYQYKTSNLKSRIPTDKWWSSALSTQYSSYMYAYPLCYKCDKTGLYISYPDVYVDGDIAYYGKETVAPYRKQILVQGTYNNNVLVSSDVKVSGYSDWAITTKWVDINDKSKYFESTLGQGFIFTYFNFSKGMNPRIVLPPEISEGKLKLYDETGIEISEGEKISCNFAVVEFESEAQEKKVYGIFPPSGSAFIFSGVNCIDIIMPKNKRYLSIGLMKSKDDLKQWSKYAYAFIKDTKVYWKIEKNKNVVHSIYRVSTVSKQNSQKATILAILPHHYKNSQNNQYLNQEFYTIRGNMKLITDNKFETYNNFNGILPYLPNVNLSNKQHLKELLLSEQCITLDETKIYKYCKQLWKVASLIPVAEQINEMQIRDELIKKLKLSLIDWFTYFSEKENRYFSYNYIWGSLIAHEPEFGNELFNDHHFHYGYFIYACAIVAMYDKNFQKEYGKFIELLIRDANSPFRKDKLFPFMRSMDIYEGHCYANGFAKSDDGNDQESSSESMNAWAGIYLWGLITGNDRYKNLGIWGYATEYSAIKEYYFDIDNDIYPLEYDPKSIGILFGGKVKYGIWWKPVKIEYIHGIQFLPITPASLYLGYCPDYVRINYEYMIYRNNGKENVWEDVILPFQALYNATEALLKYNNDIATDNGLKTFTYYWINNLSVLGRVNTNIYSNIPSFNVFNNEKGNFYYVCYNPYNKNKTFKFYSRHNNEFLGKLKVLPKQIKFSTELE
ncbi:MAG: glycosyl hydrolase [Endomicrobia bacterium]|nr:glycosyl hydrolase [Endomicrobiia bacterium]